MEAPGHEDSLTLGVNARSYTLSRQDCQAKNKFFFRSSAGGGIRRLPEHTGPNKMPGRRALVAPRVPKSLKPIASGRREQDSEHAVVWMTSRANLGCLSFLLHASLQNSSDPFSRVHLGRNTYRPAGQVRTKLLIRRIQKLTSGKRRTAREYPPAPLPSEACRACRWRPWAIRLLCRRRGAGSV